MIVSINWLKDYVDFDMPLDELADKLTMAGLECVVKEVGKSIPKGVVVGKVLERKNHPNADTLSVCKVDVGGEEVLNIVCGAPNVDAGQFVPVATVGTQLTPDFKIKSAKLRGEPSEGMICAEDELGLGDNHTGIIVLEGEHKVGTPYDSYFTSSKILDIDITANRPDAMSHWGVAREIAAITGKTFNKISVKLDEKGPSINELTKVKVIAPEGCPRYTARVIEGVKIGPSPKWMVDRLQAVGLRSINNVVDASNYVLMETGHPLHAFDLDNLKDHSINVRFAGKNEKLETIDHKERELSEDMLLICDGKSAIALAGIMGGTESEVSDLTKNVLIESAYFTPAVIRKGSKQQQLSTDASKRFERGTDPNETLVYAQDRLASLILELAGGTLAKGMIDIYPEPIEAKTAELRIEHVKRVTGIEISKEECKTTLERLEFKIIKDENNTLTVTIPTFRPDVEREIDLVEEVLRINNLDKIPSMSRMTISVAEEYDKFHPFLTGIRNFFVGYGMHEAVNNSLVNEAAATSGIWGYTPLKILNPLSVEMNMLRTDMIQPLLSSLRSNALKKRSNIRLFELANVIEKNDYTDTHAMEHYNLGVICSAPVWGLNWTGEDKPADLFYMKGILEHFLSSLNFNYKLKENTDRDEFEILYNIVVKKTVIGKIGQYKSEQYEKLQLQYPLVVMELQIGKLFDWYNTKKQYGSVPQFPSIFRDMSLVMDKKSKAETILNEINQNGGKYLVDLVLYDVYIDDEKLGKDKKALSLRLEFRSDEKTLKDEVIDDVMNKLFERLKNQYGAQLR
ncbi:MAG: phenylalanine--tRNA ligase subunit beta [Candidatus Marinimicrobia bacterium]|nr:phenylalanine--tRNA ligase subunit beta [Candidatus Neomarinimicrobiota bacterium]